MVAVDVMVLFSVKISLCVEWKVTHSKTHIGLPVTVVFMKLLQSALALDMAWSPRRDPVTALAQLSAAQPVADTAQGRYKMAKRAS